jgi:hypothetical protein
MFTTVYALWNCYVITLLILYAPSHKGVSIFSLCATLCLGFVTVIGSKPTLIGYYFFRDTLLCPNYSEFSFSLA